MAFRDPTGHIKDSTETADGVGTREVNTQCGKGRLVQTCHVVVAAVNAGAPKHRPRATGISVQAHATERCASDAQYVEYAKRRGHNAYVMPLRQVCLPYATSAT